MALKFIRALMPKEERFVEQFSAHAGRMVAAAQALAVMMTAPTEEREARFNDVADIERQADVIARETVIALHRAFITPFDRSDIHALISAQDDALDLVEEVAQRAILYRVELNDPHMLELAEMIDKAARLLVECFPLLVDINRNAERINGLCQQVGRIENEADTVLRRALSDLIERRPDVTVFLGCKEVYELLESVTDRCDDVADLIEGIVLDHV